MKAGIVTHTQANAQPHRSHHELCGRPRPTQPVPIPKDLITGGFTFSPEHIEHYRAVLYAEVKRNHGTDPVNLRKALSWTGLNAGGRHGKSALLNRIASGLWPLVFPPPVAMSYPWYDVVESTEPIELWMDAGSASELVELGRKSGEWVNNLADTLDSSVLKAAFAKRGATVPINQSMWKLLRVVNEHHLEVTWGPWEDLGFVWRLSVEAIPVERSQSRIVPWHNPQLRRITTLQQLIEEQKWHIHKLIHEMRMAIDPALSHAAMDQARQKDRDVSRFHQAALQQNLEAKRKMIAERLALGKPEIPVDAEIQAMVDEAVARYLSPKRGHGCGWYSVDEAGNLVHNTWCIARIAPAVVPESIYVDVTTIERAPEDLSV